MFDHHVFILLWQNNYLNAELNLLELMGSFKPLAEGKKATWFLQHTLWTNLKQGPNTLTTAQT